MDLFFPIQFFADLVSFNWLGFSKDSYFGGAVNFFLYDSIKIGILLLVINYIMAITRFYFPMEKARVILTKKRWFGLNYLLAALLGVVTPFCSCSSIPLFIGFMGAGIPLGVTFAFLISSPLINEASLYLFPAMFGWKVTILYNLFGILIAVLGGMLIERLKLEKYILPDLLKVKSCIQCSSNNADGKISVWELMKFFWKDGMVMTKQVFPYVLLGVAVGALIHGFVPASFVESVLSSKSWWTVPLAVVLGVPLYANSVGVLPVMESLVMKGAPLGTVFAFMTAVVALSLPEALILKKVMRWPLLVAFFGITSVGILLMGFLFNWIL